MTNRRAPIEEAGKSVGNISSRCLDFAKCGDREVNHENVC